MLCLQRLVPQDQKRMHVLCRIVLPVLQCIARRLMTLQDELTSVKKRNADVSKLRNWKEHYSTSTRTSVIQCCIASRRVLIVHAYAFRPALCCVGPSGFVDGNTAAHDMGPSFVAPVMCALCDRTVGPAAQRVLQPGRGGADTKRGGCTRGRLSRRFRDVTSK